MIFSIEENDNHGLLFGFWLQQKPFQEFLLVAKGNSTMSC